MDTYKYSDQWGDHEHVISGPPYDAKAKITCPSCLAMLDSRSREHQAALTKKHNLPPNFWDGYKRSWE